LFNPSKLLRQLAERMTKYSPSFHFSGFFSSPFLHFNCSLVRMFGVRYLWSIFFLCYLRNLWLYFIMFKKLIFLILLFSSLVSAQSIDSLLAILESHQNDEEWLSILSGDAHYHLVYVQASYNNNSYFAGRDIGLDQFNATLQATYSYRQFSASLAGIFYEAFNPPLQTTALSVNYRLPLKFPVDFDLNYGRYFFNGENDSLLGSYPNSFGLGIGHSAKFWGASADLSLLAGIDGIAPQIMTTAYGNFKIFSWNDYNSISVRPEIGFYFGSELTALSTAPGTIFAKSVDNRNGPGPGSGSGQGDGPGQPDLPEYVTLFGLLNTEMNIYLTLALKDLDMTFAVQNNRPRSVDAEIAYAPTSLISFSAGYAFSFIGK